MTMTISLSQVRFFWCLRAASYIMTPILIAAVGG